MKLNQLRSLIKEEIEKKLSEDEGETTKKVEVTPKEKEIADDILGGDEINEASFGKVRDRLLSALKKGAVTLGILTAVVGSPKLAQAQKDVLKKDIKKSTWFRSEVEKVGNKGKDSEYIHRWVNDLGQDSTEYYTHHGGGDHYYDKGASFRQRSRYPQAPNSDSKKAGKIRPTTLNIGDQTTTYDSTNKQVIVSGDYANNSRYIRVSAVNKKTPNYLDAAGSAKPNFTSSLPVAGAGVFGGASGDIAGGANMYENISTQTQGLTVGNYTNSINILKNKDAYQYNVLFTPGLLDNTHTSTITTIITNTIERGDYLYVPDLVGYNANIGEAINQASTRDTSFAASYFPWVKIIDPGTSKQAWVPASTVIPGVYAYNDRVAAPWFAPAGINRGGLSTVLQAKYKLTQANKDDLYSSNVNPLATLSREGVVVFGQKTLQKEASALDRVNVRRLVIELKSFIGQLADQVVFEQNTIATRQSFVSKVTPYLERVQQKQGLYAFKVLMDETNNGPDVIDRNQLIGQIYIQPTRTAEFISIDFILMPTGAEFPS